RGIPRCAFAAARESASGSEPGDRPELPHQDETNKTAPLGRDRAAPSSLASTANRMTTTESPFLKTINDFCNKICHKLPSRAQSLAGSYREMYDCVGTTPGVVVHVWR